MTTTTTLAPSAMPVAHPRRWSPWWVSAVASVVAFSGSGSSSLNGDELATISAATRSLPGMWELARHIDGHFLPYYLFMHLWLRAGSAELWLRLPSAVAIGVAAWFLVDLGFRLHGTRAGVTAGLVFAALPSVSYYGAFARPYAFAAAAVVLSFWALHRAVKTSRGWTLYGVAVALVCCTHLFAVLVLPAQLVVVIASLPRRALPARWLPAVAAGCVPALVLGLLGYGERDAISWIPQRGPEVLLKFPEMAAGAIGAGVLLFAVALAGAVLLRDRVWAGTLLGWLVLPPLLLLAVSHLLTPVYVDRYLFVTAPALALLAGIAAAAVPGKVWAVAACCGLVVVSAAAGVGRQIDVRDANGRFEDFPWAVRRIDARAGDAIVYGQTSVRAGFDYYGAGTLPDDVLRLGREPAPTGLGFRESKDIAGALADRARVWVVWRGAKSAKPPRVKVVEEAGFAPVSAWHSTDVPGLTVALFDRP
jgi:mannosyltransferase